MLTLFPCLSVDDLSAVFLLLPLSLPRLKERDFGSSLVGVAVASADGEDSGFFFFVSPNRKARRLFRLISSSSSSL
jgi:hypothetical protein